MDNFKTYAIIELDATCSNETKKWLESRLVLPKLKNGAEFLTVFSDSAKQKETYLHIGATVRRLLIGAEELNLKKLYKNNTFREFLVEDMSNFIGCEDNENFLSQAECLKIIDYELFNLRVSEDQLRLPGAPNITINTHEPLLHQLQKSKFIKSVFPLHDIDELKRLETTWYKRTDSYFKIKSLPTDAIRNYFGESVAFYFNFYDFYNLSLLPVAVVGLATWLLPLNSFTKFAVCGIFNLVWSTVFNELWKRRSAELTYTWGVFDSDIFEKPRSLFYGEPGVDPITDQPQLAYSKKKRALKKYLISYPTVVFSIFIAFSLMLLYYHFQDKIDVAYNEETNTHMVIRMIPSIGYSCIVIPLNIVYTLIATRLTEWENHRTQSAFENNLTTKLFVLLISMLTVNAIMNKISEVVAPYLKKKVKKKILTKDKEVEISRVEKEAYTLDQYEGTYSDYVTVFEQYGYIALFSAVFPWIAIAGYLNNIMELKSDAFKYCHVYNRPFPHTVTNIGPWRIAFEILSFVAILTNLSLIAVHPDVRKYFSNYTDKEYILLFVIIEHLLVIIKIAIMWIIPDEPATVCLAKLKYKYESIQALKREVRF